MPERDTLKSHHQVSCNLSQLHRFTREKPLPRPDPTSIQSKGMLHLWKDLSYATIFLPWTAWKSHHQTSSSEMQSVRVR